MKLLPTIVLSKTDNFIYAVDVGTSDSKVFKFEEVSAFFIQELQNRSTFEDIVRKCLSEYEGIQEDQVRSDLKDFIETLKDFGLVET